MKPTFSLSPDGQHFVYTCPHCTTVRQEPVSPARNPMPFSYIPTCSGCHHLVEIDHQQIAAIQASYARASGKKIPAPVAQRGGFRGGEKAMLRFSGISDI